jgi:menaquinol-cytochrome c reductase iron-sulfur subunit
MNEEQMLSRRDTLKIAIWTIGGLIASTLGIPAIAYIVGPSLQRDDDQGWVKLGSASKVELGVPTLFKAKITRKAGWVSSEEQIAAFVLTENGRDYIAMSNICTHLGCRVRWIQDKERFLSPCHNGIFDTQGMVISGPPPRPLDRYEVKLENDQLYIGKLYRVET